MNVFVWQDSYRIDHDMVDEQHEKLFELANRMAQSANKDDLIHNTMLLFSHVREHFSSEEQVMREHHYPGLQQHIENHDLMLIELVGVSERVQNDEWQVQDLLDFMNQWVNHILDDDSAFKEYLQR